MTTTCPNCGAGVSEGAAYCPNCGQQLAPHPQEAPSQAQPPSQQDTSSSRSAPTTRTSTPGPAETEEQPVFTSPQEPSASGLLSGWVAVAALAMVGVAAVGLIGFFLLRPDSFGGDDDPPLRSRIQTEVGDFTLKQDSVKKDKLTLSHGADEALAMRYVAPDGTELLHYLAAFPSPERANQVLQGDVKAKEADGYKKVDSGGVVGQDGQKIGAWVFLQKENVLIVVWTNDELEAYVAGFERDAYELYTELSASAY